MVARFRGCWAVGIVLQRVARRADDRTPGESAQECNASGDNEGGSENARPMDQKAGDHWAENASEVGEAVLQTCPLSSQVRARERLRKGERTPTAHSGRDGKRHEPDHVGARAGLSAADQTDCS